MIMPHLLPLLFDCIESRAFSSTMDPNVSSLQSILYLSSTPLVNCETPPKMRTTTSNPNHPNPSFFKILLDEFSPNLPLPLAFVRKQVFPENPVLETEYGGKWKVGIDKIGDKLCFVNGWLDFVRDTKSQVGDFLVFRLIGKSTFKVSIFGPNACAKDLSFGTPTNCNCKYTGGGDCRKSGFSNAEVKNVIKMEEVDDDDDDDLEDEIKIEDEKDEGDNDNVKEIKVQPFDWKEEFKVEHFDDWKVEELSNSSFEKVFTKSHNVGMMLPKRFVEDTRLNKKEKVVIRNKDMKSWSVKIKRWADGRYYFGCGWWSFWKQNKLMEGDTCSFKYSHGEDLIDIEIVKKVVNERGRTMPDRPVSP